MQSKAWGCALAVIASCAELPTRAPAVDVREPLACTAASFSSPSLTGCADDLDCAEVSSLLSGACGVFVNREAFAAHLDEWSAQLAPCDAAVQVALPCPDVRPVCAAGRCAGAPQSRDFARCSAARAALRTRALALSATACEVDQDCASLERLPTSSRFQAHAGAVIDELRRACFERLTATRVPSSPLTCLEHRCTLPADSADPALATHCELVVAKSALEHASSTRPAAAAFRLEVRLRVDAGGVANRFDFLQPATLSARARRSLAAQLHACRFQPARWNGEPVESDLTLSTSFRAR